MEGKQGKDFQQMVTPNFLNVFLVNEVLQNVNLPPYP